jgi:hypothetical protein
MKGKKLWFHSFYMLWRFSPWLAGFRDGASGTPIWSWASFLKNTVTNGPLEIVVSTDSKHATDKRTRSVMLSGKRARYCGKALTIIIHITHCQL